MRPHHPDIEPNKNHKKQKDEYSLRIRTQKNSTKNAIVSDIAGEKTA